jgi:hypothetical protein
VISRAPEMPPVSARRKYVLSKGVVEVRPDRMMNHSRRRETAMRTRPARPRGAFFAMILYYLVV